MSKFLFSIFFLIWLIADVQGQSSPTELEESDSFKRTYTVSPTEKIRCYKCEHMDKKGKCLTGQSVCTPRPAQVCMTRRVYKEGRLEKIIQDCEVFCWPISFHFHEYEVEFQCCRNKPLCNVP